MPTIELHRWLDDLLRYDQSSIADQDALCAQASNVAIESREEFEELLSRLKQVQLPPAIAGALASLFETLYSRIRLKPQPWGFSQNALADLQQLYRGLASEDRSRHQLLRILAAQGSAAALAALAELLVCDPPSRAPEAVVALAPLFERRPYAAAALFPRLLDALEHPVLAALILDLCNFLTRQKLLPRHPAVERVDQLALLLQAIVLRLQRLEESPQEYAQSPKNLTDLVGEGVGLVVALCDALALIGDPKVVGKLRQALELGHRRVRTEAAAALAQLGDTAGSEMLAELATQPVVRTRVLAYLAELGQLERVADQYRSPTARAEGELAAWLSAPLHFGAPPAHLELVDSRRLYWPGFNEPVDCYLFRYEFCLGGKSLSGVAITGPITHALLADLQDLPPADIYAAYAGWSAEHDEIGERSADKLSPADQARWQQVQAELDLAGYEHMALAKIGTFFGQQNFVAMAQRDGHAGVVVYVDHQVSWYPARTCRRPLGPAEVYYIHKGREILRSFNQQA